MTKEQQAQLSQQGVEALDKLLKETVENRVLPATYFGVTGPEGELYYSCAGEKVFGKPEAGQVDPETSTFLFPWRSLTCSRPAFLDDQVCHLARCAPAG